MHSRAILRSPIWHRWAQISSIHFSAISRARPEIQWPKAKPPPMEMDMRQDPVMKGIDQESDLGTVFAARTEWEREMGEHFMLHRQRNKLHALRALHAFILHGPEAEAEETPQAADGQTPKNPQSSDWEPLTAEAQTKCAEVIAEFEQQMAKEMERTEKAAENETKWRHYAAREADAHRGYKGAYTRALFRLLCALYRDSEARGGGKRAQQAEKAQLARLNSVLDRVHRITEQKRQSWLGALWLAHGRGVHFFDWLNTRCARRTLAPGHVEFIARVALAAKEASILEPLTDLGFSDFLPSSFADRAPLYNALVTIYDQSQQFDKMEALCLQFCGRDQDQNQQQRPRPRIVHTERTAHLRPLLHRIAQFYRKHNRRAPLELGAQIRSLRQHSQPYFFTEGRERENGEEKGGRDRRNRSNNHID